MKPRIGLFGTYIGLMQGGGETYIMHLAANLAAAGEDVTLVYATSPGYRLLPFTRAPGVRYVSRPYLYGLRELTRRVSQRAARIPYGIARRFHRWMIRGLLPGFDIVHTFAMETAEAADRDRRADQRLVLTLFGVPEPVDRALLHRMDAVVPTAFTLGARLERDFDVSGEVIPSGVDLERFRRVDRAEARRRLGWSDAPHVLYVGRFIPVKNLPTLVDAFARVSRAVPGSRLVLTGQGGLEGELRARVAAAGLQDAVLFPGHVGPEALVLQYSAADVLVLVSSYDTFPHVVLEALACGCPIVVSTGAAEIPKHFPEVTVVPWESADGIADGVIAVLRESPPPLPRARLDAFAWSRVAERYRQLYRQPDGRRA